MDESFNKIYPVKKFQGSTRRVVQFLSLRDNPELIAE